MDKEFNMVLINDYYHWFHSKLRQIESGELHLLDKVQVNFSIRNIVKELLKRAYLSEYEKKELGIRISHYHNEFVKVVKALENQYPERNYHQIKKHEHLLFYDLMPFGIFDNLPEDNPISVILYKSDNDQKESGNTNLSSLYIPFKEGATKEKVNIWLSKALELELGIDPKTNSHKKTYLKRIVAFMINEFTSLSCNPDDKALIKVLFDFPKKYQSEEYFDYSGKLKFNISKKFNKRLEVLAKEIVWIN